MATRAALYAWIGCLIFATAFGYIGLGIAIREHNLPMFTWRIPLSEQSALVIFNGTIIDCLPQNQHAMH